MTELILRPDLGKRAYRMRCRFTVDAPPASSFLRRAWDEALEKMTRKTAEMFVRDMARQGWDYVDKYGVRMTGPYHVVAPVNLRRFKRQHWNAANPSFGRSVGPESLVTTAASLEENARWDYELSAVFVHKLLLAELPDDREENGELSRP